MDEKLDIGLGKQIVIYSVSFFLPPFGLIWAAKYLRTFDPARQKVGWIAIILTAVSLILSFWVLGSILESFNSTLQGLQSLTY